MSPFRQLIHGRVDRADHRLLKAEAAARGISLSRCVGDVVREYFALRQEMLSVIKSPARAGDGHPGLVHSLVARMVEQLGVRADVRADELGDDLHRIEIMIKLLVQLYLAHTPEVPQERRTAAYAAIARRWANYQAAVAEQVAEDDRAGDKPKDNEEDLEESSARA